MKGQPRPPPLSTLQTVPSSPINSGVAMSDPPQTIQSHIGPRVSMSASLPPRQTPPNPSRPLSTSSQMFVFPPSHSPNPLPGAAPSMVILTRVGRYEMSRSCLDSALLSRAPDVPLSISFVSVIYGLCIAVSAPVPPLSYFVADDSTFICFILSFAQIWTISFPRSLYYHHAHILLHILLLSFQYYHFVTHSCYPLRLR